jgi:hypothetical protein
MKTALSSLPGLVRRIGSAFSPRLSPWATFLRPPADGLRNPIEFALAPMSQGRESNSTLDF